MTIAQSRFKIEKDESVLTCLGMMFPELRESEDERIRKWLFELVENQEPEMFIEVKKMDVFEWLKKQKEPKLAPDDLQKSFEAGQMSIVDNPEQYGLCKKAEWSEEDERVYDILLNEFKQLYDGRSTSLSRKEVIDVYNFVKSLRPSWKPSEEQMRELKNAVNELCRNGLASLYNDLQKL